MMTEDMAGLEDAQGGTTREFEFVRGEYRISGERVPYFAISMTVTEARGHLRLARQLPVNEEDPINLEELMQRDVSNNRAEGEIAAYLKSPYRLKFFNSLTVVLMPTGGSGRPLLRFPPNEREPISPDASGFEVLQAGPVRLRRMPNRPFGFLQWDTAAAVAVIIDGQHRFLALDTVARQLPAHLRPDETMLPLLVLVLDERAGFRPAAGGPEGIVKASRAIFTDLNKHALKVSSEREYLLDDSSLSAVSMRAILSSGIGGSDLRESAFVPARIPLAIVDWVRPRQVKFDDDLYVTSISALHQLVVEVIHAPMPPATAYDPMSEWIDRISARLEVDNQEEWDGREIRRRLGVAREEELPFGLTDKEIKAAADAFAANLGQVIVSVILKARPYRALIDKYLAGGLLGGRDELWLGQNSDARSIFVSQFASDPGPGASQAASEVKSQYHLAYLVVFQRAFVVALKELAQSRADVAAAWQIEADLRTVLDRWIRVFNETVAPHLNNDNFWLGTAVTPADINFGQIAKKAVMGLALLLTLPLPAGSNVNMDPGDVDLLNGVDDGTELDLLSGDRLITAEPAQVSLLAVAQWRQTLASIAPGPAMGGDLGRLYRSAARAYREGIRRHIEQVASVNGRELTDAQRDRLVLAFGARRLAYAAARRSS